MVSTVIPLVVVVLIGDMVVSNGLVVASVIGFSDVGFPVKSGLVEVSTPEIVVSDDELEVVSIRSTKVSVVRSGFVCTPDVVVSTGEVFVVKSSLPVVVPSGFPVVVATGSVLVVPVVTVVKSGFV